MCPNSLVFLVSGLANFFWFENQTPSGLVYKKDYQGLRLATNRSLTPLRTSWVLFTEPLTIKFVIVLDSVLSSSFSITSLPEYIQNIFYVFTLH